MAHASRSIEHDVAHRPWPLPRAPWVMFQGWRDLLFAHWPVPPDELEARIPPGLALERFEGRAWIGLTPFLMSGLRARGLPALPGISDFPEMNLRTYVRAGGRPGIFFFSLDAASALAVAGARAAYRLPYRLARMRVRQRNGWIHYRSRRPDGTAGLDASYRGVGPVFEARPGTFEHFVAERYALFTVLRDGRILQGDIHHRPWALRAAEAVFHENHVPAAEGLHPPPAPPRLHFSARQDTLVWLPRLAEG